MIKNNTIQYGLSHWVIYLLNSDFSGKLVDNKVLFIKHPHCENLNVTSITKEEFLKYKTKNHFIIEEDEYIYIIPKKRMLEISIYKLQGKL